MAKLLSFLKRFAVLVSVGIIYVGLSAVQEQRQADRELQRQIAVAVQAIDGQRLSLPTAGYRLEILPAQIHRSDREINRMLRQTGDVSGNFTFQHAPYGTFTMSAQGVDSLQHLVHAYLEGYQPFAVANPMLPLYVLGQRKSYQLDAIQYRGRDDVWQSSREAFYYPRGDCEDHAIALADWLIAMGEDARVAIGDWDGGGHAWVVLFREGREFLLEATDKSGRSRTHPYPAAVMHPGYHPRFMFNREYFWENTGSRFTTRYSGSAWVKKSRYRYPG